jgi:hypothetical protein
MDIELVRLRSEVAALETLVVALTRSLAGWQPGFPRSLQATAEELRQRYQYLPLLHVSPENAELVSADFQEAWERLMKLVQRSATA